MGPFDVELCSICGTATNKALTRPVTSGQPYLSVNGGWNRPAWFRDARHTKSSPADDVIIRHLLEIAASFVPLLLAFASLFASLGSGLSGMAHFRAGRYNAQGKPARKEIDGVS
jgi:hypothetical protein